MLFFAGANPYGASVSPTGSSRRGRWRTVGMPLLIMAIAGGIAVWAAQREVGKIETIEAFVTSICRDIGQHYADTEEVPYQNATAPPTTLMMMELICTRYGELKGSIDVEVASGDLDTLHASYAATHTATIMLNGQPELLLRLRWHEPPKPIEILGFWDPDAAP